nr:hypothetical protein [Kibdelosporangium sp. MJ126-NF4]
MLTTTDDSLNKAHVRYLEARLINIAKTVGAVRLDNGTSPDVPWLSEPEVSDMEAYLANMLVILPIVGVHAFELPIATDPSSETGASGTPAPRKKYFLRNQLTTAEGTDDSRGFTVFAGALGRREPAAMSQGYLSLRTKLLAEAFWSSTDWTRFD